MTKRKVIVGKPKNQPIAVPTPVEEAAVLTEQKVSADNVNGVVSISAPIEQQPDSSGVKLSLPPTNITTNIVSKVHPAGSKTITVSAPSEEPVKVESLSKSPAEFKEFIQAQKAEALSSKIKDGVGAPMSVVLKQTKQVSPGEVIWNDIKDRSVAMFALQGRKVSDYATFHSIDPAQCFVSFSISAFLPQLEAVIADKYEVEQSSKYVVIKRK